MQCLCLQNFYSNGIICKSSLSFPLSSPIISAESLWHCNKICALIITSTLSAFDGGICVTALNIIIIFIILLTYLWKFVHKWNICNSLIIIIFCFLIFHWAKNILIYQSVFCFLIYLFTMLIMFHQSLFHPLLSFWHR